MINSVRLFYSFLLFNFAQSELDGYITGGAITSYKIYPHSVFLSINCHKNYVCGGSILNQDIVLTAAHCTQGCEKVSGTNIQVKYGHETISKMDTTDMINFMQHQNYDDEFMTNDICLISVARRIPLGDVVKRIILMKNPPKAKYGYVAGWGIDENQEAQETLKHTSAAIQEYEVCQVMRWLPDGTFCAGPVTGLGSADEGDSGGALVIYNYIQIGIVSFNVDKYSLVAYTNTSYHFEWIRRNARNLVCSNSFF